MHAALQYTHTIETYSFAESVFRALGENRQLRIARAVCFPMVGVNVRACSGFSRRIPGRGNWPNLRPKTDTQTLNQNTEWSSDFVERCSSGHTSLPTSIFIRPRAGCIENKTSSSRTYNIEIRLSHN